MKKFSPLPYLASQDKAHPPNRVDKSWFRQVLFFSGLALFLSLGYASIFALNPHGPLPVDRFHLLNSLYVLFFVPLTLGWLTYRPIAVFVLAPAASGLVVIGSSAAGEAAALAFVPAYGALFLSLLFIDREKNARIIAFNLEAEKAINEKNDLEVAYREKGTSISVYFEKYTSYYNLRNLAADFSTTLSLKYLCELVVAKTIELIQKGDWCLLLLSEGEGETVSLMASKSPSGEKGIKTKSGDLFDFWVLRNRKSLIVTDLQKDFRFDLKKVAEVRNLSSLIASPIIHEGRVRGTLRLQSPAEFCFSTDDLRILDVVTTLASSAISNCILFQKTEELAIRDSLTGLFVQRYFLERLSEEHKRSLMTNSPLTLLMCDLDHFKARNDQYGHGVGDMILTTTASLLRSKTQEGIAARYGGEEFAILLPKIAPEEGLHFAESIRKDVEQMNITVRREPVPITISIGIATIPYDTLDAEELIRIADRRLYQAKRGGRNRVCGEG